MSSRELRLLQTASRAVLTSFSEFALHFDARLALLRKSERPCSYPECLSSSSTRSSSSSSSASSGFFLCGSCCAALYCSSTCQQKHFLSEHSNECKTEPKLHNLYASSGVRKQQSMRELAEQRLLEQTPSPSPSVSSGLPVKKKGKKKKKKKQVQQKENTNARTRAPLKRKASSSSSSSLQASSGLKKRTSFSQKQKTILQKAYDENPYVDMKQKTALALEANTDISSIAYYFVNQRARAKQANARAELLAAQPSKKKKKAGSKKGKRGQKLK
jgi:hypothetical protein